VCVTPEERRPRGMPSMADKSHSIPTGEAGPGDNIGECPICLDSFSSGTLCTLPCKHEFHGACVEELRKQGMQQACPVCRSRLPPGAEQLFIDAQRMQVRMTMRRRRAVSGSEKESMAQIVDMLTNAANQGHMLAQCSLGCKYTSSGEDQGYLQDYDKAVHWFRKSADQGCAVAQLNLGTMYQHGEGVGEDYNKAARWYRKAAAQGNANAQFGLGKLHTRGSGVVKDYNEAARWFHKAADQGHADAQCNLGVLYLYGMLGPPNDLKSAQRFLSAAEAQGDERARELLIKLEAKKHLNLGNTYPEGIGVAQDHKKAAQCYRKASDQGDVKAQFNLGNMYFEGKGVAQDNNKAAKWYRKAAEEGDALAQGALGDMYYLGKGVARDINKAVHWCRKAADQGHAASQTMLGVIYSYGGDGFRTDLKLAQHFLSSAEAQGDEEAREFLKKHEAIYRHTSNEFSGLNAPSTPIQCTCCSRSAGNDVKLKPCPRCKGPLYCGTDCQRTHWDEGHKEHCSRG